MATDRIYKDDTAVIDASITASDGINYENVSSVTWELLSPDDKPLIVGSAPVSPVEGQRIVINQALTLSGNPRPQWSVLTYTSGVWVPTGETAVSNISNGQIGTFVLPGTANYKAGLYRGRAQFTLTEDGSRRSTPISFESINLVDSPADLSTDPADYVVDRTWAKLNDLFDSTLGGPYLRDKTKQDFDKVKLRYLLDDTLYNINMSFQPPTTFDVTNFPFTTNWPLAAQALLVDVIYHLMRSYVEQPTPANSSVPYLDRRDYLQRWGEVVDREEKKLETWLETFKNGMLDYGHGAMLIGGYASPLVRSSRTWRSRFNVGAYRAFY